MLTGLLLGPLSLPLAAAPSSITQSSSIYRFRGGPLGGAPDAVARANAHRTNADGTIEIHGELQFERNSSGVALGCLIGVVQLDPSWCGPFEQNRISLNCKAIIRLDGSLLVLRCE